MTALVLGLITASAKSAYDELDTAVLALDRVLARYGSETRPLRAALQEGARHRIDLTWPDQRSEAAEQLDPSALTAGVEGLADRILALSPQSDGQRYLQSRAVELSEELLGARWLGFGGRGTAIPPLFLAMLLFWLAVTFASFGLYAPLNGTVLVFLIYEMDEAFDGWIRVSADPMRFAHAHMNR
jgi:hypothetical protein